MYKSQCIFSQLFGNYFSTSLEINIYIDLTNNSVVNQQTIWRSTIFDIFYSYFVMYIQQNRRTHPLLQNTLSKPMNKIVAFRIFWTGEKICPNSHKLRLLGVLRLGFSFVNIEFSIWNLHRLSTSIPETRFSERGGLSDPFCSLNRVWIKSKIWERELEFIH